MSYIEIKNVSKSYKDKKVLENISLKIDKGKFISFIGSYGSGKTTLLKFPESDFEMLTHLTESLGNIAQHLNNRRRDYAESESVKMIALLVRFIERK